MKKLYVWDGDDVLKNYASGIAVVLADSVEQARECLREELTEGDDAPFAWAFFDVWDQADRDENEQRYLGWLASEPKVFDPATVFLPQVFYRMGGE